MPYNLAISPDFKPDQISGWYIFNTWLQKKLDEAIHLDIHQSFAEQHQAIDNEKVDIVYANPFDISRLVREKSFTPVARPVCKPDEAIIACREGAIREITELPQALTVAQANAPEVNTIGMIMLEPANIDKSNIKIIDCENFVVVARHILKGEADVGFFLAESFNELSNLVKKQLYPLINSQINMIHHAFMLSPKFAPHKDKLKELLINMKIDDKGIQILNDIGIEGFESMEEEDAEFMIDLMDTLLS